MTAASLILLAFEILKWFLKIVALGLELGIQEGIVFKKFSFQGGWEKIDTDNSQSKKYWLIFERDCSIKSW